MNFENLHLSSYLLALLIVTGAATLLLIKRNRSLILRWLALVALIFSLFQPFIERVEPLGQVRALLDISDSVDESMGDSLLRTLGTFSSAGLIVDTVPFSGTTAPTGAANPSLGYQSIRSSWSILNRGVTNLEQAVTSAPSDPGSIVILSDGFETAGAIEQAIARGTISSPLFPLIPEARTTEAGSFRISNLYAPLVAPSEKSVEIRVSAKNSLQTVQTGLLTVTHDGNTVYEKRVSIPPGAEVVYTAPSDPSKDGIREIVATLKPDESALPPTTERLFISGASREKVLLLNGTPDDARYLNRVLQSQAYKVEGITLGGGSTKLPSFEDFSTVLLNNVSLAQLPPDTGNALKRFVTSGGGLIMIGGPQTFGLGGFRGTPLEEISPVEFLPPQTIQKRVNVAVELVLDKSRSMAFDSKLDAAKDAAREVIRNLKDEDYVGVIGFDSAPFVAVKLGRLLENRELAMDRISRIFPARKTNLLPALDEARRALTRVPAGRKHVIVLTDGKIPDEGPYYLQLVKEMRLAGITASTVLVGAEADPGMLQSIAELGGGAFYQTTDARTLPRIFLKDIKVSTGEQTMREQSEYLVRGGTSGMKTTTITSFPPIRGYVQTKAKEGANLELVAFADQRASPLLASWSVGKGRVVAFTSDANGRWSNSWVGWGKFQQFWSDAVDSTRSERDTDSQEILFDLRHRVTGNSLLLDASIFSESAKGVLTGQLKGPSGVATEVAFTNISPGRFTATTDGIIAGDYELRMKVGSRPLTPVGIHLSGELFGEKKGLGANLPLLSRIAAATGGKINPSPAELLALGVPKRTKTDLAPWFIALGLGLLLLEILLREGALRGIRQKTNKLR